MLPLVNKVRNSPKPRRQVSLEVSHRLLLTKVLQMTMLQRSLLEWMTSATSFSLQKEEILENKLYVKLAHHHTSAKGSSTDSCCDTLDYAGQRTFMNFCLLYTIHYFRQQTIILQK